LEKIPINSCRFVGQLYDFSVRDAGGHILGKGEIRLTDSDSGVPYQAIKLIAWYYVAEQMAELPDGTWVNVLSSYSPNFFAGKLYDQFTVTDCKVI
jgi:hypothetical protein